MNHLIEDLRDIMDDLNDLFDEAEQAGYQLKDERFNIKVYMDRLIYALRDYEI